MSTLMKFESGNNTLQFIAGGDYPASRPVEVVGILDRTASGALQFEKLGITIQRRAIVFTLMPKEDYTALINWFINVAEGSKNTFTFTDEYGDSGLVRIIDNIIDFSETSLERYSGTLTLEYGGV